MTDILDSANINGVLVPNKLLPAKGHIYEDATVEYVILAVDKDGHFTLWLNVEAKYTSDEIESGTLKGVFVQLDMEHMPIRNGKTYGKLPEKVRVQDEEPPAVKGGGGRAITKEIADEKERRRPEEFTILTKIRVNTRSKKLSHRIVVDEVIQYTLEGGFYPYVRDDAGSETRNESIGCNIWCLHVLLRLAQKPKQVISEVNISIAAHAMAKETVSQRHVADLGKFETIQKNILEDWLTLGTLLTEYMPGQGQEQL